MQILEAGDSALLVELEPVIDPAVNARAIGLASSLRKRSVEGVRDIVSTFRSLAVHFDPLMTDVAALRRVVGRGDHVPAGPTSSVPIEVPAVYGGEAGPDLDSVAAFASCTPEEVVRRHSERSYRVFMLGFLPGFAYMAPVDEAIAAPRRAAPRARVPAGSIGIAGRQTGIYPRESPGGWQIIGRTVLEVFSVSKTPPALFSPGDTVRFVPVPEDASSRSVGSTPMQGVREDVPGEHELAAATRFITVLRPGMLTTIQDEGRWGYQALGVSVSGAMDARAHRMSNALVGNPRNAATLEVTLLGPELRFEQRTRVAIAGADLDATIDGSSVPLQTPLDCRASSVLRFGERRAGTRAYVACDGGIAVPPVLGSRATHLGSGLGGLDGRQLRAGDRLPLGALRSASEPAQGLSDGRRDRAMSTVSGRPHRHRGTLTSAGGARLRILPGPQAELFDRAALDLLQGVRYTVTPHSDRMGYRLAGESAIRSAAGIDMISDATFAGAVQVPPAGQPILLMADRQTTGGYPQLAVVISADLPIAAQLAPGDSLRFEICDRSEAIAALVAAEGRLLAFE